jgi:hypothetical protein
MPPFPPLLLTIAGIYFTLSGVFILLNQPSIETRLRQLLNLRTGRESKAPASRETRLWAGILLTINGLIMFILGILAGICFLAPGSNLCIFL